MRQVIDFLLASVLLVAGLLFLCVEAFVASHPMPKAVGVGVLLTGVGGAWLWSQFVRPQMRGKAMR
jgi:hypothetical protein